MFACIGAGMAIPAKIIYQSLALREENRLARLEEEDE